MKILLFILFLLGVIVAIYLHTTHPSSKIAISPVTSTKIEPKSSQITDTTLFVPYWTGDTTSLPASYTRTIYFGIAPNDQGIDTSESGYTSLAHFVSLSRGITFLALRVTDQTIAKKMLEDTSFQKKVIDQTITIAKQNHFSGVVLDLEYQALAFTNVIDSINNLNEHFYTEVKANQLQYLTTIYGDTFYRIRPYDVKTIAVHSDGILVMAYDFHKAKGNPGPNFPFSSDEGYDFQMMVNNFLADVPAQKLTIVFGLFGYDWPVDSKGQATDQAESLTDNQIQQKFLQNCSFKNCQTTIDPASYETKISYVDKDEIHHIVWFENQNSMQKKEEFLKTQGISSVGLWAYSYF